VADYPASKSFRVADEEPVDVARVLADTGAEVLVSDLPVGSEKAARHYAAEAKEAVGQVVDTAKRAAEAFAQAFKKRDQT
jgi:myo-inositol-1-phosphate synthase